MRSLKPTITTGSYSSNGLYSTGVGTKQYGIAIDLLDNIWVANYTTTGRVTKFSATGVLIGTFNTGGQNPTNIAVDYNNNIWVLNPTNNIISKLNNNGTLIGTYNYTLNVNTSSIAIDIYNNVWVTYGSIVYKINNNGVLLSTYTTAAGSSGIAIDIYNNVWVGTNGAVVKLNLSGTLLDTYGTAYNDNFAYIGIAPSNNIWALNTHQSVYSLITQSGVITNFISIISFPSAIAFDSFGNGYVANATENNVKKINSSGGVLSTFAVTGMDYVVRIVVDKNNNFWATNYNSDSMIYCNGSGTVVNGNYTTTSYSRPYIFYNPEAGTVIT